jgi:copper chaperone CopZ
VTNALTATAGVRNAQVDLKEGKAVVDYDEGKTTPRDLANAVTEQGYTAEEVA